MEKQTDFHFQTESMTAVLGAAVPAQSSASTPTGLPCAVVIPQRRPRQRDRGFIRAYAPDLMRCGIDQATFLSFLDAFNAEVTSSPWVGAVDLAGGAVGAIPASVTAVAPITGTAVQIVAGIYKEISARKSQNAYLQKMNDQLFRPRGLYCLIMAYDINSYRNVKQQDTTTDFGAMVPGSSRQEQGTRHKIRSNDGVAGVASFPAAAELIFPDADDTLPDSDDDQHSDGEDGKGNGSGFLGKLGKFAAEMNAKRDLRSQVKFQRKNPTSAINSLLDPKAGLSEKDLRKQDKREVKQERKRDKAERKAEKRQRKHPEKSPKQPKIKPGILYLMIVNMPTSNDMKNARRLLGDD